MLCLSPEIRLLIHKLVLICHTPIALADDIDTTSSILRTCRLFHEEGAPIFYGKNNFTIPVLKEDPTNYIKDRLGRYATYIRHLTVDVNLGGASCLDRHWNWCRVQVALMPACMELLREFGNLHSFTIYLTAPHYCFQHHNQLEETLCAMDYEDCIRLFTKAHDQLRRLGGMSMIISRGQNNVSTMSLRLASVKHEIPALCDS
jgi:hypothetical protein